MRPNCFEHRFWQLHNAALLCRGHHLTDLKQHGLWPHQRTALASNSRMPFPQLNDQPAAQTQIHAPQQSLSPLSIQLATCRPREKQHRPQTRRRRENNEESLDKMRTLRTNLVRAYEVHEWLTRREGRKYSLVVCHVLQSLASHVCCLGLPAYGTEMLSLRLTICEGISEVLKNH